MSTIYFAWADAGETTFGPEHEVVDEQVLRLTIRHEEGDFAAARVEVPNPGVGLLSGGRQRWAWISYDDGGTGGAQALFFGRLLGLPSEMNAETVELEFIARPPNFDSLKRTLADSLRVLPYFDPVFVSAEQRDEPDVVLEARNAVWHIDRTSHAVTISEINNGEDGTLDFGTSIFYDPMNARPLQPPVRRVRVEAEVGWQQRGEGRIDLKQNLIDAFEAANSARDGNPATYTGEGLTSDWPSDGVGIGAGWSVWRGGVERGEAAGWAVPTYRQVLLTSGSIAQFPLWTLRPELIVAYDAGRSRSEVISFDLEADTQEMLTDAGDAEVLVIALSSIDVAEPIDDQGSAGFTAPIGDVRRKSYFLLDRGRQSLEYCIALARARLLARARAVEIKFETTFESALTLSCRKNARIVDSRLPGGEATGKVVGYVLEIDGDAGLLGAQVTIGCTVGRDGTVSASAGTPDYVATGYVEVDYQTASGEVIVPIAGEVGYTAYDDQQPTVANGADDGIDLLGLDRITAVQSLTVISGKATQESVLGGPFASLADAEAQLNEAFTEVELVLVPLNTGPFDHAINVTVTDLKVPKTIDLEAGAT